MKAQKPRPQIVVVYIVAALLAACQAYRVPPSYESLNAVLWMQRAAEFRSLCLQAYGAAGRSLDAALDDPDWTAALEQGNNFGTLPPAVVLDIDETVLDNSPYEAGLIGRDEGHDPERWDTWCLSGRATAIPGALEFCAHARKLGVAVIYISNREENLREATARNLREVGFPVEDSRGLLLRQDTRDKTARRQKIAARHRILLLIGDSAADFAGAFYRADETKRLEIVRQYRDFWGIRWIVIPNPAYGDWLDSLFGYEPDLPARNETAIKYRSLKR
jgi:5'-nucleotidase (lipoprotein e(P4) family)